MNLRLSPYLEQRARWPASGRHILAQHDEAEVVVYQAYRSEIADWAVAHQQFGGPWSFDRMSWIKPNFLWMAYLCGWATEPGQERVLAVRLARSGFEQILAWAVESRWHPESDGSDEAAWRRRGKSAPVRMQWDPDHAPGGAPEARRAIQLGLRAEASRRYATEWALAIEDVTDFVRAQHPNARSSRFDALVTPTETVFLPASAAVRTRLRLSEAG